MAVPGIPSLRRAEIGFTLIANVRKSCVILLVIKAVSFLLVSCQVSLRASNFRVGTIACPGDKIVFYCSVNGSPTLFWSSIEYIGSNGAQLEFSSGNSIGTIMNSTADSRVFANLTNVTNGNFLQSTLHLTSNQNSTVSCLTVNAGSRKSISFTIFRQDPPGTPQNAAATEIPSDQVAETCVLLVTWNPPDNADESTMRYIVRTSRETEIPEIVESSTLASFLSPCEDLVGITVNVTAVDICGNQGGTTNNFEPSFTKIITDPSDATSTTSTTSRTSSFEPSPQNTELSNSSIVGVTVLAVLTLLVILMTLPTTIIVICAYIHLRLKRMHNEDHTGDTTQLIENAASSTEDTTKDTATSTKDVTKGATSKKDSTKDTATSTKDVTKGATSKKDATKDTATSTKDTNTDDTTTKDMTKDATSTKDMTKSIEEQKKTSMQATTHDKKPNQAMPEKNTCMHSSPTSACSSV